MLLTKKFGPRQRVGIVITDLDLEPDPIYDGPQLCNKCMACVTACPGKAISGVKTVKVNLAGHDVEWGELDQKACDIHFRGAIPMEDVQKADEYTEPMYGKKVTAGPHSPFKWKPKNLYNAGQAICGARGCTRACMISMENRGILENKFKAPFRRRKPWKVDWSQEAEMPDIPTTEDVEKNRAD